MEFNVQFTTNCKNFPLVEKLGEPGIDLLDDIRESDKDFKDLPCDKIYVNDSCPINGHLLSCNVNEDVARASKRFKGKTTVRVKVLPSSFSRFISLHSRKSYVDECIDDGTNIFSWYIRKPVYKRVLCDCTIYYNYDIKDIMDMWAEAGYPLEWTF